MEKLSNMNVGGCVVETLIMLPSNIIFEKLKEEIKNAIICFWDWWYDEK